MSAVTYTIKTEARTGKMGTDEYQAVPCEVVLPAYDPENPEGSARNLLKWAEENPNGLDQNGKGFLAFLFETIIEKQVTVMVQNKHRPLPGKAKAKQGPERTIKL